MQINKLFSKTKDFVPIEIDEMFLNMAHVRPRGPRSELVNIATINISGMSRDGISDKIKDFIKNGRIRKPEVINVIPSNLAISKNIEVPSVDEKEIREIIELQAGRHTPYSRDEVVLGYSNIGSFNRYTKILLVIAKKETVTTRYDIIKRAGFKAERALLSVEPISKLCYRVCPDSMLKTPMVVVHIDSIHSDFSVVYGGKTIYLRSIPIGTLYIGSRPGESKQIFIDEIKKSLDSYQSENIEAAPSKIYFTGVTDMVTDIVTDEVSKLMNVSIDFMPYAKMFDIPRPLEDSISKNRNVSLLPMLASVMVSDQTDISLIPEEVKIGRELKKKAKKATQTAVLFMAVLIIFFATLLTNLFFKKAYLQRMITSYAGQTKEGQQLESVSEKTSTIKRLLGQKGQSLTVLTELFKAIPKEVYLNSVELRSDDTMTITGTADNMSRIFSMVTELGDNKSFDNVKVDFTKARRVKDQEMADFGLTFTFKRN